MRKTLLNLFFLLPFIVGSFLFSENLKALTFEYPEYNVDISINKDSSFKVTEKAVYIVNGEFHGLRRDLTLSDPRRDTRCTTTSNLYCGGFDRVVVNSVKDLKGNDITDIVRLYKVSDEDTSIESLRFEWEIFPNGQEINGEMFGWILEYTIYGGIINAENIPYFYWNALPENRNGIVKDSKIRITLPNGAVYRRDNLQVFSSLDFLLSNDTPITLNLKNLPAFAPFTVAYKFEPGEINLPGQISYNLSPPFGSKIILDGIDITEQVNGVIKAVPVGDREIRFEHIGYETQIINLDIKSGETTFLNINLTPLPWMQLLLLLNNLICICGCVFAPFVLLAVYLNYRRNGRDKEMPKTIIPLFKPPVGVMPYMAGAIIDEQVDRQDIVGTIIDLAYRGFLKIKELEKEKNYLLTKIDRDTSELNPIELKVLNAIFNTKDSVETKDLGASFPAEYLKIQNDIYNELESLEYFKTAPNKIIGGYITLGIFLIICGVITVLVFSWFLVFFLGILTFFMPSLLVLLGGIGFLIAAKFMPAKTAKGSKVYADTLGFKMYMNTAERYTVQKLEPEDFVKYLSYAIVFKIEKEWANRFKDIYKGIPEWYEGNGDLVDAIWISSFARNFSNSTVANMNPVTSGSSSGSGWSGGGSFGGFSGGGGGGGSSGGW